MFINLCHAIMGDPMINYWCSHAKLINEFIRILPCVFCVFL